MIERFSGNVKGFIRNPMVHWIQALGSAIEEKTKVMGKGEANVEVEI